jgi:hypothetical protein
VQGCAGHVQAGAEASRGWCAVSGLTERICHTTGRLLSGIPDQAISRSLSVANRATLGRAIAVSAHLSRRNRDTAELTHVQMGRGEGLIKLLATQLQARFGRLLMRRTALKLLPGWYGHGGGICKGNRGA